MLRHSVVFLSVGHHHKPCKQGRTNRDTVWGRPAWLQCTMMHIRNEIVPLQLAQCRFPGLAICNAKLFFKWNIRKQFCQTALGNCYGLKLPKCWLQFKNKKLSCHLLQFSAHFCSLALSGRYRASTFVTVQCVARFHLRQLTSLTNTTNCFFNSQYVTFNGHSINRHPNYQTIFLVVDN